MIFEFDEVPHPDDFLFHYTSLHGVLAILGSGVFRFSDFGNTNDPRENKRWNFGFGQLRGDPPIPSNDEMLRVVSELSSLLRESVQLACFTQDQDGIPQDAQFLRGYSRARNWDQYADKHRGACLVFDRDRFEDAARSTIAIINGEATIHCGPVKYVDMQSTMLPNEQLLGINTRKLRDQNIDGIASSWVKNYWELLYFRKNTDWASEKEYRV